MRCMSGEGRLWDTIREMDLELDRLPESPQQTLPTLTSAGHLPPGDFAPSRVQFEAAFVNTSPGRKEIYLGWNRHREALSADGLMEEARQLLNGSFTTSKLEPADLDLAVEVPTTTSELASLQEGSPVLRLLLGPESKKEFSCDAYPIYCLPENDPAYEAVTVQGVRYWTKWFARTREGKFKGRVWARVGGFR